MINIPPALVLGCNTPHGINVLADWIEEQTGHPFDLDQCGWSEMYCYNTGSSDGNGDGYGYGYIYNSFSGGGSGYGYGYWYGDGCGYGYKNDGSGWNDYVNHISNQLGLSSVW